MVENYNHLVSLGYQTSKPDVLSKWAHGQEPWITVAKIQNKNCPGIGKVDSLLQEHSPNQRLLKSVQQCNGQNTLRNTVHHSKTHFPIVQNHDTFDLYRKNLKSSLSLINQKRRHGINNPVEFIGGEKTLKNSKSLSIRGLRKLRNPMHVLNVSKPSLGSLSSFTMRTFIYQRILEVVNVRNYPEVSCSLSI